MLKDRVARVVVVPLSQSERSGIMRRASTTVGPHALSSSSSSSARATGPSCPVMCSHDRRRRLATADLDEASSGAVGESSEAALEGAASAGRRLVDGIRVCFRSRRGVGLVERVRKCMDFGGPSMVVTHFFQRKPWLLLSGGGLPCSRTEPQVPASLKLAGGLPFALLRSAAPLGQGLFLRC